MTNKEIVEMLKLLKEQAMKSSNDTAIIDVKKDSFDFVMDSAIKALKQEQQSEWERDHEVLKAYADGQESVKPCKDAISRQAVIDSLHSKFADGFDSDRWWNSMSVLYAINKVPSVSTEKTGRWIPVSERLPKEYDLVLVTEKYGFVDTAHFAHNDLTEMDEWIAADDETFDVIAWMPLPQPYKAESEDK